MKKLICVFSAIALILLSIIPVCAASYEDCLSASSSHLYELAVKSGIYPGSVGGEWSVISLFLSGKLTDELSSSYQKNAIEYINQNIDSDHRIKKNVSTENSRLIIALTACGIDASNVSGHNLVAGLSDLSYLKKQGLNGPIWALIALDSHNYKITAEATATRQAIIDYILSEQLDDGGWNLSGHVSDPDVTSMAITSLSRYISQTEVKAAVDKAVVYLSTAQNTDGTFTSYGSENSQSCSQVIVALCSLGINPLTDSRFIKNGNSVADGLCSFYTGYGFGNTSSYEYNQMGTEQGVYALSAVKNSNGKSYNIFDFSSLVYNGDADLSGKVEVADARTVLRIAINLETAETTQQFNACDFDHNGSITVGDARLVLRTAIGLSI